MGIEPVEVPPLKPVNYQAPLITLLLSTNRLFPGDSITGKIQMTLSQFQQIILSDISLKIKLSEHWIFAETSEISKSDSNIVLLSETKINLPKELKFNSLYISLTQGIHQFPFSLPLPKDIPPSFEFPLSNRRAYIRYSLIATIISPYIKTDSEILFIVKARPLVLNSPLLFSNCTNVHRWGMFSKGTTVLTTSYKKNNYRIGDSVPIEITVDNIRGELDVAAVKVRIERTVTFKKNFGKEKFPITHTINEKKYENFKVPKNSKKTMTANIIIQDNQFERFNYNGVLNPFPKCVANYSLLMPCVNGIVVKCEYAIKVSVHFSSWVSFDYRPRVYMPISVTHQLMKEFEVDRKEKEDIQKAIEESKKDLAYVDVENQKYIEKMIIEEKKQREQRKMVMSEVDMKNNNRIFQQENFEQLDFLTEKPNEVNVIDGGNGYENIGFSGNNGNDNYNNYNYDQGNIIQFEKEENKGSNFKMEKTFYKNDFEFSNKDNNLIGDEFYNNDNDNKKDENFKLFQKEFKYSGNEGNSKMNFNNNSNVLEQKDNKGQNIFDINEL